MAQLNSKIICADGFSMSVQASSFSYCEPRIDNAEEYQKVEVGFPSDPEPLIIRYAEDPSQPTETVYGWVPVDVVLNVCAKHGGVVRGELPQGIPMLDADF